MNWRQDHAALVEEIRRLKKLRTTPHQPDFGSREQYALLDAKKFATRMYIVRAGARGKNHTGRLLPPGSWEEKQQTKVCDELRVKYSKPDPEERAQEVEASSAI